MWILFGNVSGDGRYYNTVQLLRHSCRELQGFNFVRNVHALGGTFSVVVKGHAKTYVCSFMPYDS